jgi:hypothetical protein
MSRIEWWKREPHVRRTYADKVAVFRRSLMEVIRQQPGITEAEILGMYSLYRPEEHDCLKDALAGIIEDRLVNCEQDGPSPRLSLAGWPRIASKPDGREGIAAQDVRDVHGCTSCPFLRHPRKRFLCEWLTEQANKEIDAVLHTKAAKNWVSDVCPLVKKGKEGIRVVLRKRDAASDGDEQIAEAMRQYE